MGLKADWLRFGPRGWILDPKAGMWACGWNWSLEGGGRTAEKKEEKEREKFPHISESIGHPPLLLPKIEAEVEIKDVEAALRSTP